ncbi:hypothetical protein L1279_000591 [Planomicrobium sp. HSC-17F08]|nr:hypothetical protein [Planomicrobium sp. HSC-17F08]
MILIWLICLITPTIAAILLPVLYIRDNKHSLTYSLMTGFIFGVLAFAFIPVEGSTSDLVYYFTQIDFMTGVTLHEVLDFKNSRSSMVAAEIFYFMVNRLGNQHFLPAISMFITYAIATYITTDLGKRLKIKRGKVLLILIIIFFILPFPSLVSNVRNIMAFSISLLAVYNDIVKKKRNIFTLSLYILPIFLHISSLLIIIIRLLLFFYKGKGKILVLLLLVVSTFSSRLFEVLLNLIPNNITILNEFTNKGLYYVSTNDSAYISYLQNSAFAQIEKVFFVSLAIFFVVTSLTLKKEKSLNENFDNSYDNNKGLKEFNSFFLLLCVMVIASIPVELTTYARFSWATLITSPILLLQVKFKMNIKNSNISFYTILLFIFGAGGLIHQVFLFIMMSEVPQTITRMLQPTFLLFK